MPTKEKIIAFRSGNRTVRRSAQHSDMWLISFPDGGWYSIHAGEEGIQVSNPPNKGSLQYSGNSFE